MTRRPRSWRRCERTPDLPVTVDLEEQTIVCGNRTYNFSIDPVRRMRLLNGWDDIALTESYRDRIATFKADDQAQTALGDPAVRPMKERTQVFSLPAPARSD